MSTERFCPECGTKVNENERFCHDCGADLGEDTNMQAGPVTGQDDCPGERTAPAKEQTKEAESQFIGKGARINATGGISNTSNSVSTTTSTSSTSVNTSNVDNSSTVNHNTTIVMGGKEKSEYCEVCGNPFGDRHAKCPKCGKQICFDCKVKNKNRCIECEKKAINEYRVAFQQLLLTTNGNIGIAGRQMMDSKARELDVEDVKASIEKELADLYRPAAKPVQPAVTPSFPVHDPATQRPATATGNASGNQGGKKGVGTLTGGAPMPPRGGNGKKDTGGNNNKWIIPVIACIIIAAIAVFILMPKGEKDIKPSSAPAGTEQTAASPEPEAPEKQVTEKAPEKAAPAKKQQVQKPAPEPEKDSNYEAGMAAYDKGEGKEAVKYFNASGSADAYYMLGVIYEQGCGSVGKNAMMARKNFKKAAELGNAQAKAKL